MKQSLQVVEKLYYRRQEAAFALGISVRVIDYMIAAGMMSKIRIDRAILIPTAEVQRMSEEMARPGFKMPGNTNPVKKFPPQPVSA